MRHKHYQLSEFLCRELLYDYATGQLDADRKEAMKHYIKDYPDLETEFQALKQGLDYTQKLSQTKVPSDLVETALLNQSLLRHSIHLLKTYKWRIASLIIGVILLILIIFFSSSFTQNAIKNITRTSTSKKIFWQTNLMSHRNTDSTA